MQGQPCLHAHKMQQAAQNMYAGMAHYGLEKKQNYEKTIRINHHGHVRIHGQCSKSL